MSLSDTSLGSSAGILQSATNTLVTEEDKPELSSHSAKASQDTLKNGLHKHQCEGNHTSNNCFVIGSPLGNENGDTVRPEEISKATSVAPLSKPISHGNSSESEQTVTTESSIISSRESCDKVEELCDDINQLSMQTRDQCVLHDTTEGQIKYVVYESELQMPAIMSLITKDLSEPYSIYTYRYFIHNWPNLCYLAQDEEKFVGAIVCKLDLHKKIIRRGYIAMLAVDQQYRKMGIGTNLVLNAIQAMMSNHCDEVVLETEITNHAALHLYEKLGFVRDKRLFRYYLNGVDALRLKLWLR